MTVSHRAVAACLVLAVLSGLVCAGVVVARSAGAPRPVVVTGGCPRSVKPAALFGPSRMILALRALKAQVPRVFANLTSMGHPAWPNFQLQALVRLNQLPLGGPDSGFRPAVRGLDRYETLAARACGKKVALESVLVFLQFPSCQLPCSIGWAYLTPTRAGWHLWTSYQI